MVKAHSEPGVRFMTEASSQFELLVTEVGTQPEVSMFAATAEQVTIKSFDSYHTHRKGFIHAILGKARSGHPLYDR